MLAMPRLSKSIGKYGVGGDDFDIEGEADSESMIYRIKGMMMPFNSKYGTYESRRVRFDKSQLEFDAQLESYNKNLQVLFDIAVQKNLLVHKAQMCMQLGMTNDMAAHRHENLKFLYVPETSAEKKLRFNDFTHVIERIRHRAGSRVGLAKIKGGLLHDVSDAGQKRLRVGLGVSMRILPREDNSYHPTATPVEHGHSDESNDGRQTHDEYGRHDTPGKKVKENRQERIARLRGERKKSKQALKAAAVDGKRNRAGGDSRQGQNVKGRSADPTAHTGNHIEAAAVDGNTHKSGGDTHQGRNVKGRSAATTAHTGNHMKAAAVDGTTHTSGGDTRQGRNVKERGTVDSDNRKSGGDKTHGKTVKESTSGKTVKEHSATLRDERKKAQVDQLRVARKSAQRDKKAAAVHKKATAQAAAVHTHAAGKHTDTTKAPGKSKKANTHGTSHLTRSNPTHGKHKR